MPSTQTFAAAAVAAPHMLAAEAGRAVLAEGGNAVEAMVAMAAAIAIVYPHMNGIGGDGFWLIREPNGRLRYIEACGFAGAGVDAKAYRDQGHDRIPPRGPLSVLTVPGAIGGWQLALEHAAAVGGRMPLRDLLHAGAAHARDGYGVSASEARYKSKEDAALRAAPGFAQTFLVDGETPEAGTLRKVPALGATLDQLARAGLDDFYRGDNAREIAADLGNLGSPVTRADLRSYRARHRQALSLKLPGVTLHNTPPPTQGLASLIILGVFERLGVTRADSFEHLHGLVEATKRAFAIRDAVIADHDAMRADPADFLTEAALDAEAGMIDMRRAATLPVAQAHGDTIWMGAIDKDGRAVSYIQSVYWEFGSGCVLPKTGLLMQNRGMAFSLDPASHNPLLPGRRPFHTLNPPLAVFDDGRVLSYGTMGGDGQPQIQAQVFTRLRFGATVDKALDAPRFLYGRTWGAPSVSLKLENRFDPSIVSALEKAGHEVEVRPEARHDSFGHAGALMRGIKGEIAAGHDPRSDGGAAGV